MSGVLKRREIMLRQSLAWAATSLQQFEWGVADSVYAFRRCILGRPAAPGRELSESQRRSFVRSETRHWGWIAGTLAALLSLQALGAHPGFDAVVQSVLHNGRDGQLPPNLSLVLGIGKGDAPLIVKQAVVRDGPKVRVFNVSVVNPKDIVILRTNEQERTTKAYLLSATGKLRTAVSYHAGEPTQQIPTAGAISESADEIKYWTSLGNKELDFGGRPHD